MKNLFLIVGLLACTMLILSVSGPVILGLSHLYQSITFSESKVEKEVLNYLEKKYGREFIVHSIDYKLGIDRSSINVSPTDELTDKFKVVYFGDNYRDKEIRDDYMSLTWKKEADPLIRSIFNKYFSTLDVHMEYNLLLTDIWLENTYNDLTLSFPQTLKIRPDIFFTTVKLHMLNNTNEAQISDAVLLFTKELQQLSINPEISIYIYDEYYFENYSTLQSEIQKVESGFSILHSDKIVTKCYLRDDELKSTKNILACLKGE
ncbi:hypothetical protein DNH61_03800 [Paenibacillus sambharensis]|uniref:Uncharacterized protein n=1 Tax=Paenibacillus sambharensis TaxID=1803190 RepID=A0A2W1LEU8_9BACL|nr:hypothetical protein [Paenibacillus sambharensis]PZD97209.1 hypothetical protein DNH61_03800 [Paenibacillus sambharensis]